MNTHNNDQDYYWMGQAIAMAKTALYSTAPNPRVGCIIVRNGQVLGSGATQVAGGKHAEIVALESAKQHGFDVAGATIYVSLEPCSHTGRTPPCTQALIQAKPAKVVIAMLDPNPKVCGKGVQALKNAGIEVITGIATEKALELNPGFVSRMLRNRPWVWLKTATSVDGYTALPSGESKWITGISARGDGQHWRARSCVVLTGSGTVAADNPLLNVRDIKTPRQPVRAILDTDFSTPSDSRIFDGETVWVFTCADRPEKAKLLADKKVEVIVLPKHKGKVDLKAMLQWMADKEINEVHVEAGARLSGAFLETQCVDEIIMYMAPKILGQGIPMADMTAVNGLENAHQFEFIDVKQIGDDVRLNMRHVNHWNEILSSCVSD